MFLLEKHGLQMNLSVFTIGYSFTSKRKIYTWIIKDSRLAIMIYQTRTTMS